jgi:hypothetical protein
VDTNGRGAKRLVVEYAGAERETYWVESDTSPAVWRLLGFLSDPSLEACGHMVGHGGSNSELYKTWKGMLGRCCNTQNRAFQDYGGRGISVCARWMDFWNFVSDMGSKPSPHHSIDRIDNDGDYEPGNCRWATATEQTHNQRLKRTNTSGHNGVSWFGPYGKYQARITANSRLIHLGWYADIEDAIAVRKQAEQQLWGQ